MVLFMLHMHMHLLGLLTPRVSSCTSVAHGGTVINDQFVIIHGYVCFPAAAALERNPMPWDSEDVALEKHTLLKPTHQTIWHRINRRSMPLHRRTSVSNQKNIKRNYVKSCEHRAPPAFHWLFWEILRASHAACPPCDV